MAWGSSSPIWPLTSPPKDWTALGSFGAPRDGGDRRHQGVDLYAPVDAPLLALEDGVIVGKQGWDGSGTAGVWVDHSTYTALYGAVRPGSFGATGTAVKAGVPFATIGKYPKGSSMLHFEAWQLGTRPTRPKWYSGDPPSALYDPSEYLQLAKQKTADPQNIPSKKGLCGGDVVTADGLDLDSPASIVFGVQVPNQLNVASWRSALEAELELLQAALATAKTQGKGGAAVTKAKSEEGLALDALEAWSPLTLSPGDAVAALSEQARRTRCARLGLEAALEGKPPPKDDQGQGGGSSGGGAGLLVAGAVVALGAGLFLRRGKK